MAGKDKAKDKGKGKADEDEEKKSASGAEGEEGADGAAPKKKLSPIKLALFAGVPVLVILIGLGAAFFLGLFGGKAEEGADAHGGEHGEGAPVAHGPDPKSVMFYDLPEVLVNLNTDGKQNQYLKLQVALELPHDAAVAELEPVLPRIMDRFQVFLREMRLEDLSGSAGTYRLKQELLRRVRLSGVKIEVHDVLIREMIIQ